MVQINNLDELKLWLSRQGIETAVWGQGNAKSVPALWNEIQRGEIQLHADPPLREVQIVQIIIRRDELILLEVAQEMANGQHRQRHIPPSEKLCSGEDYLATAQRGLYEEMGLAAEQIVFQPETYRQLVRTDNSLSYPGLITQYTIHSIEAWVPELPTTDFWVINKAYGHGDPAKRHLWGWRRPLESNIPIL